jgi:hypothetical protein
VLWGRVDLAFWLTSFNLTKQADKIDQTSRGKKSAAHRPEKPAWKLHAHL